jgi:hypothetical protein
MAGNDIIYELLRSERSVFRLNDIAMMTGSKDFQSLNKKLNYHVRTGKILNPRKGIYAKPDFSEEELACNIFTPSYISFEYVLLKEGLVFQYDPAITSASYLSRSIGIGNRTYRFRKLKGEILANSLGVESRPGHISMASPERAFLDILYLDGEYHIDNLNPLNKKKILTLLPLYRSKTLAERIRKILEYV